MADAGDRSDARRTSKKAGGLETRGDMSRQQARPTNPAGRQPQEPVSVLQLGEQALEGWTPVQRKGGGAKSLADNLQALLALIAYPAARQPLCRLDGRAVHGRNRG